MGLGTGVGCFLIGSGPSLNEVDVARLAHLDTISFNRSYVAWKQWGFAPTLYACLDPVGFEDNAFEIRALIEEYPCTRFFLPDGGESFGIRASGQVSLIRMMPGHTFSADLSTLADFGNVGATSLQILALLGYRRVALSGVDARYSLLDKTSAVADKNGFVLVDRDSNHFCPEYARGKRQLACPDYGKLLGQWPRAAQECAGKSMAVRNASLGSALNCFSTTDFASAIEWVAGS